VTKPYRPNVGIALFNASGKVIGLFTYGARGCDVGGDVCVTYAVPIKHARFLLSPQRNTAQ